MEDLTGKAPAPGGTETQLTSSEWNNFYQELKNIVSLFFTLSVGDLQQLSKSIAGIVHRSTFYNETGVANAYVLAALGGMPALPGLGNGSKVSFRPGNANTGVSTVNVNSLGVRTITREDGTALQSGDISTSRDAVLRYDSSASQFRLLNYALGAPAQALPHRFIKGLTMNRNSGEHGSTPAEFKDIAVQPGSARDEANSMNLVLSSEIAKRFDANVAAGTGAGGYPNVTLGARSTSTWYRVFMIGNSSTGAVDVGYDSVANDDAAALIADYNSAESESMNSYRQLGWVRTSASSATELVPFMNDENDPNVFIWSDGPGFADYDPGSARVSGINAQETITIDFCPPGSVAMLDFYGYARLSSGSVNMFGLTHPTGFPDSVPSRTNMTLAGHRPGSSGGSGATPSNVNVAEPIGSAKCRVDGSQQMNVRWFTSGSGAYPFANTKGFLYER